MDFKDLRAALANFTPGILFEWFPQGQIIGREFCIGDASGAPGKSLKFNLDKQIFQDFSTDLSGDIIGLYAAKEGIGQREAGHRLSDQYLGKPVKQKPKAKEVALSKPPAGASIPSMFHGKHGKPVCAWSYIDAGGELLFYIARYNLALGKVFHPWSWSREGWVMKGWPAPRPIYGLEQLAAKPEASVIVVEGEKACEALRTIAPDSYAVVTWPGGSKSIGKADWTPTHGRKILIWPDADTPGVESARELAGILSGKCPEIKMIDVSAVSDEGWDAADAVADGWDWKRVQEWAKPLVNVYKPTPGLNTPVTQNITNVLNVTEEVLDAPIGQDIIRIWSGLGVQVNRQGTVSPCADNVFKALEGLPEFKNFAWFDDFHLNYLTTWKSGNCKPTSTRPWTEEDDLELMIYFQRNLGLSRINEKTCNQAMRVYAHRRKRNEPKDWLSTLKWDGVGRIEWFFPRYFGVKESLYSFCASKNFWIGLAARIYKPGCKLDNMVVLVGDQGTFKSTSVSLIGGKWGCVIQDKVSNKDFLVNIQGKLIVEIAELDAFKNADLSAIKATISNSIDRFRIPYGRLGQDHPRKCIFIGTTNKPQFLQDETGARRFWPMKVGKIDHKLIEEDRDQLFAEALARFNQGENWWVMPQEATESAQESHRHADSWEPVIRQWISRQMNRDHVHLHEIAKEALEIDAKDIDMGSQKRLGRCLRSCGWEVMQKKIEGKNFNVWCERRVDLAIIP